MLVCGLLHSLEENLVHEVHLCDPLELLPIGPGYRNLISYLYVPQLQTGFTKWCNSRGPLELVLIR